MADIISLSYIPIRYQKHAIGNIGSDFKMSISVKEIKPSENFK